MRIISTIITIKVLLSINFLLSINDLSAQSDKSQYYSYGQGFYYQTFLQETASEDSINIIVQFKIVYDAIAFTKNSELRLYEGMPEVELSIKNKDMIIKSRSIWRDTLRLYDYDKTVSKDHYTFGAISVDLPKNDYTLNLKLSSKTNKRLRDYVIEMPKLEEISDILDMIFVHSDPLTNENLSTIILNDNLAFTDKNTYVIFSPNNITSDSNFTFSLKKIKNDEDEWTSNIWSGDINISGNLERLNGRGLSAVSEYPLVKNKLILSSGIGLYYIDLSKQGLIPGEYNLIIYKENKEIFKQEFYLKWFDRPYSLREINYAMVPMKYILSREEYDIMLEGSDNEVWQKFLNYWHKLDPTPSTQYNEVMNEFFKRVDYAFFNYQTSKTSDGVKTDRGMIYILNGQPTSIDRKMIKGKTSETWVYENINKVYYFEAEVKGIYRLVEVKDIN